MQLGLDVIDGFRKLAYEIDGIIREIPFPNNLFGVAEKDIWQPYHLTDTELVMVYSGGSQDAEIAFSSIAPTKILSLEVDEPIKLRESVKSVNLDTWTNAGSTSFFETLKWTEQHTRTEQLDIASSIEASVSAKVGAEYAGFKAELQSTLTAKLGINHNTQATDTMIDEHERKFEVPAWKRVSVVQKKSVSDFHQMIRTRCELSGAVRITAGNLWEKRFDSIRELNLYLIGGGGGSGDVPELDQFVNQRKLPSSYKLPTLEFTIETDRVYKDVETGEVTRSEVDAK